MASLLTALGIRSTDALQSPPSLAAASIIWQFIFAHFLTAPRFTKRYYGLDNNVSPREDLAKYGQPAVQAGKITQRRLDQLKRAEAAHANGIDHFPLFVAAIVFAQMTGLPPVTINRSAVLYTVARTAYTIFYIMGETDTISAFRGIVWWVGNFVCFRLLWLSGKAINGSG